MQGDAAERQSGREHRRKPGEPACKIVRLRVRVLDRAADPAGEGLQPATEAERLCGSLAGLAESGILSAAVRGYPNLPNSSLLN